MKCIRMKKIKKTNTRRVSVVQLIIKIDMNLKWIERWWTTKTDECLNWFFSSVIFHGVHFQNGTKQQIQIRIVHDISYLKVSFGEKNKLYCVDICFILWWNSIKFPTMITELYNLIIRSLLLSVIRAHYFGIY